MMKDALEEAMATLTRSMKIRIEQVDTEPEDIVGHVLFCNDSHLLVKREDGCKLWYLRTNVLRVIETPL